MRYSKRARLIGLTAMLFTVAATLGAQGPVHVGQESDSTLIGSALRFEPSQFRQLVTVQAPSGRTFRQFFEPGEPGEIDLQSLDPEATTWSGTYSFNVRFFDPNDPDAESNPASAQFGTVVAGSSRDAELTPEAADPGPSDHPVADRHRFKHRSSVRVARHQR